MAGASPSGRVPRNIRVPGVRRSTYEKSSLPMIGVGIRRTLFSPSSSAATWETNPVMPSSLTVTGYPRISLISASAPCAAASPLTRRSTPSRTRARVRLETVRIRPEHARCLRDHIARAAGLDLRDGDHGGIERVDPAGARFAATH